MDKKHLFTRLHKWGIANAPAVETERFTEACFVERFGRRRQSRLISLCPLWLFSLFLYAFCAFLWLKNPRNLRNLRLINDLRAYKSLYRYRDTFTDVVSALANQTFYAKQSQIPKKSNERNRFINKGIRTNGHLVKWEKRTQNEPKRTQNEPNSNPIRTQYKAKQTQTNSQTRPGGPISETIYAKCYPEHQQVYSTK
jgi:hypothetical protein